MSSLLEITWTDPVTGCKGYVVIDTLVRGLASGGLRLRKGCTLDEVRGLAQGMTRKESLVYDSADHYVPLGGGKGGIDVDPADPVAHEVLARFLAAVRPVVREQWNTGEDFGLRQETIDKIAADLGLASTVEAVFATLEDAPAARQRLAAAFAVMVDGISLGDLVGGYGVARAALEAADRLGLDEPTAVVQGFGSIGGAAARYLAAAGVKVVAVADRQGLLRNDDGLDVEALLAARDGLGIVDRAALGPDITSGERDDWLAVPCDALLVPTPVAVVLVAVQALFFALGAGLGVQHTPTAIVFKTLVRPRLSPPAELEDPRPPRFAQAVGLGFTLVALVAFVAGSVVVAQVAIGMALAAALLNAAFGFCLGCELYLLGLRLRTS